MTTKMNKTLKQKFLILCEGRHEIKGASEYIFKNSIDPTDLKKINADALLALSKYDDYDIINIYVTGLTVALVAAINATTLLNKKVVLWHYDKVKKDYYKQEVLER